MATPAQERMRRTTAVIGVMVEAGGAWSWGDDDGLIPWTDRHGHDVVPFWATEDAADVECGPGRDAPEERPVFLGFD